MQHVLFCWVTSSEVQLQRSLHVIHSICRLSSHMTAVLTAAIIDVFCAGPKFTKGKILTVPNNVKGMQGMHILEVILWLLLVAVIHLCSPQKT